jgi:hypothetical protein
MGSRAGIVCLQVTVVDDRNHQQRQAHLPSAEDHGIHGPYDRTAGHKFADENQYSACKNAIEIAAHSPPHPKANLTSSPKVCKLVKLASGGSA